MPRRTVPDSLWIDLYSEPEFRGRLYRLSASSLVNPRIFDERDLPVFGSIIVGPDVSATFHFHGTTRPLGLSSKTILPDGSRRLGPGRIRRLVLESAA
jgi:hypothetical protein